MHRPLARALEEFAEQVAVEAGEHEPLRATRRAGDDVDVLRPESAVLNQAVGIRPGQEGECAHHHNGSRSCNQSAAVVTPPSQTSSNSSRLITHHSQLTTRS